MISGPNPNVSPDRPKIGVLLQNPRAGPDFHPNLDLGLEPRLIQPAELELLHLEAGLRSVQFIESDARKSGS